MKRARAGWATTKSKFADASSGVSLDPKLVTVIEASFASTSWSALQSHLADPHVSDCLGCLLCGSGLVAVCTEVDMRTWVLLGGCVCPCLVFEGVRSRDGYCLLGACCGLAPTVLR